MSTVTVTAAGGNQTGATVVVNGVPAALSKITRIGIATPTPKATPTPARSGVPTATATAAANACLPSSSIGILVQGTNATAYAPKGAWQACVSGNPTGVNVVPIETSAGIGKGGPPTTITTPNVVNSCSSNSSTGQTVCVANNTDVYLITGSTLNSKLTSGATGLQGFSGGNCENCGVVVDSSVNKALITVGLTTGGPGGFQFLDLGATPPTFETPIPVGEDTSENVSIDPKRRLVLSPNEAANYQILNISTSTPALFNNHVTGGGEFDSAAEDCTTGIALATVEFTGELFIADLTQAKFTPGSPAGTWTAPSAMPNLFPDLITPAGTDGVAVAPGTHLGIVTSEFGGNLEGVVQLPSTSGTGTPAAVDSAEFTVPNLPTGPAFSLGCDPHTVTAYVSPNTGKALAVLGNGDASFLAVVDIEGVLKAPRTGKKVNNPLPAGLVTFIPQ
jgi:hypothetical protein